MATKLSEKLTKFAKRSGFGDNMKNSKFGKITEYIKTKSAIINIALSTDPDLGIPVGKSIMLAGPTSSGKTQIALSAIKQAQEMGYTVVYWDAEFAAEESIFKSIEADLEDIIHMPMAELEVIKTAFMQLDAEVEEGDKVLHIFDSMGAWITNKTVDDALSGKEVKDMSIPGSKKGLMTLINQACGKKHMGAIIINHTYVNVGGFGSATTISGGGALYMPSVILEFLTKARWKKDQTSDPVGNIFSFVIKKSRLSRESAKESFAMSNDYGISKYYGLLKYATEGGYLVDCKHGRSKAYQLKYQVDTLGEEAPKTLEKDLYTLYETEEVFGNLLKNTDFRDYIKNKFSYGLSKDAVISEEDLDPTVKTITLDDDE